MRWSKEYAKTNGLTQGMLLVYIKPRRSERVEEREIEGKAVLVVGLRLKRLSIHHSYDEVYLCRTEI